jgi:hypothetical protein
LSITAAALVALAATPARAAAEGSVLFQLTLLGDVPANASFRILRDTVPPSIIEPGLLVCGPADPDGGDKLPACQSGETYELESPPCRPAPC